MVSSGRTQDIGLIPLPPAALVTSPDGFRPVTAAAVTLLAEDRSETFTLRRGDGATRFARALLLGTCAGRGGVTVAGVPLPCDGRTHTLRDGPLDLADELSVVGTPDPVTGRTSLDVNLEVAEPVR